MRSPGFIGKAGLLQPVLRFRKVARSDLTRSLSGNRKPPVMDRMKSSLARLRKAIAVGVAAAILLPSLSGCLGDKFSAPFLLEDAGAALVRRRSNAATDEQSDSGKPQRSVTED